MSCHSPFTQRLNCSKAKSLSLSRRQDGLEQVLVCLAVNMVSIVLDIIILSIFFPT
jgi:hypothetical protein